MGFFQYEWKVLLLSMELKWQWIYIIQIVFNENSTLKLS